jgi:hypothetical protein
MPCPFNPSLRRDAVADTRPAPGALAYDPIETQRRLAVDRLRVKPVDNAINAKGRGSKNFPARQWFHD